MNLTIDIIQNEVCKYFSVLPESLYEDTRKSEIVKPRQITMFLSKEMKVDSDKNIGKRFGRSRALVINTKSIVQRDICTNPKYAFQIEAIRNQLKGTWKDIPGYERYYQISTFGEVRSVTKEHVFKNGIKKTIHGRTLKIRGGCVELHKDGVTRNVSIKTIQYWLTL